MAIAPLLTCLASIVMAVLQSIQSSLGDSGMHGPYRCTLLSLAFNDQDFNLQTGLLTNCSEQVKVTSVSSPPSTYGCLFACPQHVMHFSYMSAPKQHQRTLTSSQINLSNITAHTLVSQCRAETVLVYNAFDKTHLTE